MSWDDNSKRRQIRDNKGQLVGYIDEFGSTSYVRDQKNGTIGFTKKHDASGPGYSYDFKAGRVAHTDSPEYMLGVRKQKEAEEKKKEEQRRREIEDERRQRHERDAKKNDGSDPKYKRW